MCFGSLAEPTFPAIMVTNSNQRIFLVGYVALLLLLQLTGEDEKICVVYGTNGTWEVLKPLAGPSFSFPGSLGALQS